MAITTIDDGILNLQAFVALLSTTTGDLTKLDEQLDHVVESLTQLDGEVAEDVAGLNTHLEELATTVAHGVSEAHDAIVAIGQAAGHAEQTVGEELAKVGGAASDVEGKVATIAGDVATAHTALDEEGFAALGRALSECEQGLAADAQGAEQAIAALATELAGFESTLHGAHTDAVGAFDEAIADLTSAAQALEAAAAEAEQTFEGAAGQVETAATSLASEIEAVYGALAHRTEAHAQEWEQAAGAKTQEAVSTVEAGGQEHLEQPATALHEEALVALTEECSTLLGVLDGALTSVGELEPLSDELVKCRTVAGQIDELLNALAE